MLPLVALLLLQAPLIRGHAHNDYEHPRPLLDALEQGFTSIEADIFLVDGELLVAHDRKDVRPERTLRKLYLDPIAERIRKGTLYDTPSELWLLVDIKQDGPQVYEVLKRQLRPYQRLLTRVEKDKVVKGSLRIVLSGDRPIEKVSGERSRLVFLDGRLENLGNSKPELFPLISDSWLGNVAWLGGGTMPVAEQEKVRTWAEKAHASGQKLRLWGTPDRQEVWQAQYDLGVDFINTDRLADLAGFLRSRR